MIRTMSELDKVRKDCRAMVTKRALASAGTAAIPVPGAGIASVGADTAMLFQLLPRINRAFGLSAEQIDELDEQLREQVLLIAGKLGNVLIGRVVTEKVLASILARVGARVAAKSAASLLPIFGSAVAAGISFGMMKYVGNTHIDECYEVARQLIEAHGKGDRGASPIAPATGA